MGRVIAGDHGLFRPHTKRPKTQNTYSISCTIDGIPMLDLVTSVASASSYSGGSVEFAVLRGSASLASTAFFHAADITTQPILP